jgi:hypothetical protein
MKLVTEKDELLRRYLLDEMSDEEREQIEEKFLEDDSLFEEIAALEDELYFDYQQERLSQPERLAFEKKFLATPQDFEKAKFTEVFLQATDEIAAEKVAPSLWQSISTFFTFSNSAFKFGAAVATILILFAFGFLLFNNPNNNPEVAEVPEINNSKISTPAPNLPDENLIKEKQKVQEELQRKLDEEKQKQAQDADKIKELEQQKEKLNHEIESNRQSTMPPKTEQRTFVALVLSPLLRGTGTMPKAKLGPETKTLNLTLSIKKGVEAEGIKIIVRDVDSGGQVWGSSAKLGNRKSLSLNVPAKNLKRGDYEIVLINSADNEELDSYYFSVDK